MTKWQLRTPCSKSCASSALPGWDSRQPLGEDSRSSSPRVEVTGEFDSDAGCMGPEDVIAM